MNREGTTMTDLLKKLGDDWHVDHPYMPLIEKVLPSYPHALELEKKLIEVYTEEFNGYKLYKNSTGYTLYDNELEVLSVKKKILEEEKKKEEDRFNKLLEKLKEHAAVETSSEEEQQEEQEEEEEEEEEEVVGKQKGKGPLPCRRTLKKQEDHKKILLQGIKSSMASSQVKLIEFAEKIETNEKMSEYYTYYRNASRDYILATKKLVLAYSENKDLSALIQGLADVISYYEHMMRRYVPSDPCDGHEKGLCKTHWLPLSCTIYPNQGYKHVWTCAVSP